MLGARCPIEQWLHAGEKLLSFGFLALRINIDKIRGEEVGKIGEIDLIQRRSKFFCSGF